jgi:hypothetical protein
VVWGDGVVVHVGDDDRLRDAGARRVGDATYLFVRCHHISIEVYMCASAQKDQSIHYGTQKYLVA